MEKFWELKEFIERDYSKIYVKSDWIEKNGEFSKNFLWVQRIFSEFSRLIILFTHK